MDEFIFHCIDHDLFIPSPTDGHLGCFHCLAIMNNASVNIHSSFCVGVFSILFLGAESLGHTVILCLTYWENDKLFSKIVLLFYNPIINVLEFQLLHIFTNTCYFPFLKIIWSGITLWFWFAFAWWLIMLIVFSHANWPFVWLAKCLFISFAHFFSWVFCLFIIEL